MATTAWEIQNRLAAILNFARQSGKSYIDVESSSLQQQLTNVSTSERNIPLCREVMIKLMRPGDSILRESAKEKEFAVAIRYLIRKPAENFLRHSTLAREK
jgi:hypothetical protein